MTSPCREMMRRAATRRTTCSSSSSSIRRDAQETRTEAASASPARPAARARPPLSIGASPVAPLRFPGERPLLAQAHLEERQEHRSAEAEGDQCDGEHFAGQPTDQDGAEQAGDDERRSRSKCQDSRVGRHDRSIASTARRVGAAAAGPRTPMCVDFASPAGHAQSSERVWLDRKPRLEIKGPDGSRVVARPDTETVRSRRDDHVPNMSHVWVERFGQSYFLTGQQRLDDALLYVIEFPDGGELQALLRQFDDLSFALLYRTTEVRSGVIPSPSAVAWNN